MVTLPYVLLQGTQARIEMEEKAQQANYIAMLEALTFTIDRIACEVCEFI